MHARPRAYACHPLSRPLLPAACPLLSTSQCGCRCVRAATPMWQECSNLSPAQFGEDVDFPGWGTEKSNRRRDEGGKQTDLIGSYKGGFHERRHTAFDSRLSTPQAHIADLDKRLSPTHLQRTLCLSGPSWCALDAQQRCASPSTQRRMLPAPPVRIQACKSQSRRVREPESQKVAESESQRVRE